MLSTSYATGDPDPAGAMNATNAVVNRLDLRTPVPTSGRFLTPTSDFFGSGTGPDHWGDNAMALAPLLIADAATFDAIAFGLSSNGSGTVTSGDPCARLGVYADEDGYPNGASLIDSGPLPVASATHGDVLVDIDLTLQPGRYWLAYSYSEGVWDGDTDYQGSVVTCYPAAWMTNIFGISNISGVTDPAFDGNGPRSIDGLVAEGANGLLPTFTSPSQFRFQETGQGVPLVALRFA